MTDHKITGKQMQGILVMFWLGSLIAIGGSQEIKQDYWIAVLVAVIPTLPITALYCRLVKLYPEKNLYDILFEIFGKVFGRIISLLFVLYSLHLGSMVTKIFSSFVRTVNMPETPETIISVFMIIIAILSVLNGPESIGRTAKFVWKIFLALFIFTCAASIKDIKIVHLMPVMTTDFKVIMDNAYGLFALPMAEGILCLSIFSAVGKKENVNKIFIKAVAITIAVILIISLRNVLLLGGPSLQLFYFPSSQAVSIISFGEFFSRFEVIVGINMTLCGFTKICVCLYSSSLGLSKVLNMRDQKMLVVPCAMLIGSLSQILYKNTQDMFAWVPFYRIYALPFEVILPVIILIGAEIKYRAKSNGEKKQGSPDQMTTQPETTGQ